MRITLLLIGFLLTNLTQALEIKQISAEVVNKRYEITLIAIFDVPKKQVFQILTDYENLHKLNKSFTSSRVIEKIDQHHTLSELITDSCVLFFCVEAKLTEVVKEQPHDMIIVTIRPEESDFHFGRTVWKLSEINSQQTQLEFSSVKAPKFWVPPVIGDSFVKSKLQKETIKTLEGVERVAKE